MVVERAESIKFITILFKIDSWTILPVPAAASKKLPSRGQVMVEGTFNGVDFKTPLEPDGKLSHWCKVDARLLKAAGVSAGSHVTVVVTPVRNWPEPDVPTDWQKALATNPQAAALWQRITPMARWEWIRWARATSK
ncbi:MAG TPA: YdeI/OmpD-associated family protein, partial [Candidatus Saccharimonas sp.]|nr:YdeI/OmpD-associated family protein [Candidatus Saccharimonas sp.]